MIKTFAGLWAALLLTGATVAQDVAPVVEAAACSAATPPEIMRPTKPTRPLLPRCVNEARGTHNCRGNVLRDYEASMTRYEGEFNAYVDSVNGYIRRLEAYTLDAVAYAECERRIVLPNRLITG
jgi:hypothetical protein